MAFATGQYIRSGQGSKGTGNRSRNFHTKNHPSMRAHGAVGDIKHSRPMIAGNPNLEMSQDISQLSMDSSLRTNSQSSQFLHVPLGQPSASTGSYNSHNRSSTSSMNEHMQHCRFQNESYPSSGFPNGRDMSIMSVSKSSRGAIRSARPSLLGGLKLASFRVKNKEKKTRFADTNIAQDADGRYEMSQNSNNDSSWNSTFISNGSQHTTQSGRRIHHNKPFGYFPQNSQKQSQHRQQRHRIVKSQHFLPNFDNNRTYIHRESQHVRVLRGSASRSMSKSQHSSTSVTSVDPIFAKTATPRKKLDVPYPPIGLHERLDPTKTKFEDLTNRQDQIRNEQHGRQQQLYGCSLDTNTASLRSNNGLERGSCDPEVACRLQHDKDDNNGNTKTSTIDVAEGQTPKRRGRNSDKEILPHDSSSRESKAKPSSTLRSTNGPSTSIAFSNEQNERSGMSSHDTENISVKSKGNNQQERHYEVCEAEHFDSRKDNMDIFKTRLQKLMDEMECEAKTKIQNISHTITSAAELRLDEKTKAIQESLTHKFDEKANVLHEATQSNLGLLDQKRSDTEKSLENLFESKSTKLDDLASESVKKLEACTESNLSKLSKYTETWLADHCSAIANRLKPYLFLSTEKNTSKQKDSRTVINCSPNVQESTKKPHSVLAYVNNDGLKRDISTQLGVSLKKDSVDNSISSVGGEASQTQGSKSSTHKVPVKSLRRSKRTKQRQNVNNNTNKRQTLVANMTPPRNDQKIDRESITLLQKKSNNATKGDLPLAVTTNGTALCVTPTAGNSEFAKKSTHSVNNESTSKSKEFNHPSTKRRKRRRVLRSPLSAKRSQDSCDSSRGSVPSEVVAAHDIQLSPLEDTDLLIFSKTKDHSRTTTHRFTPTLKPLLMAGKKRHKNAMLTYQKRKKIFDVTEHDGFKF